MKCSWIIYLFIIAIFLACGKEDKTSIKEDHSPHEGSGISLKQLTAEETGIHFNNALVDTGNLNVFIWNFLYTGAGVAAGDINNDGLADIYFAGNQVRDRLYLNKGNFKFEDITEQAGIPDDGRWTTGVTMADVNADGLLDIYVCKNSPTPNRNANRNRLFINLGNSKFTDQASQYGLADEGLSIQATFFDHDQDGDLDMFLINQPFDQLARLIHPAEVVQAYPVTDRFFENVDGRFVDRTTEMNMNEDRYGLGVSLGDYDANGWTDIYLCNDYAQGDVLYMNYNGQFKDELKRRVGHTSFYSMGSDAGDVNNDGWEDLFILDMAFEDHYRAKTNMESMQPEVFWDIVAKGHHYPYAQNTLQLNRGDGHFTEVAQFGGLSKTDWSWATLMADLDQDGWQDLLVTNGIMRDMKNNDFTMWVKEKYQGRVGPTNYKEVLAHMPSSPVAKKIYRNLDGLRYEDISAQTDFGEAGFAHGMAYADFDNNGSLDIVVNQMNAPAGIYQNASTTGSYFTLTLEGPGNNKNGLGIPVVLCAGGKCSARTMQTSRGYFSSCPPFLHFGLGSNDKVDSVLIYWNAREMTVLTQIPAHQTMQVSYSNAQKVRRTVRPSNNVVVSTGSVLPFTHKETSFDDYKEQVLLPYKLSQNGPFIASGDIDNDGLDDLFVGGAAGQAGVILKQAKTGVYSLTNQPDFQKDAGYEDMEAVFFDLDGDQDQDLYVSNGSNEIEEGDALLKHRMYLNDGKGIFSRNTAVLPDDLAVNGQCVEKIDADGDGDMDLFVGGRLKAGAYPIPASSVFLINEKGLLVDKTTELAPFLKDFGLVTDAITEDLDKDGDQDILVVGEWMSPTLLINDGRVFRMQELAPPGVGLWWTVEKGDFDGDSDTDFILGNLGWNNKFGGEHPKLSVYAADFDQSGDNDVVLAKKSGDSELPYRGRECSSEEMPFIASRFPTYDAFAKAKLPDILGAERLSESVHLSIETFASVLLQNEGGLKFTPVNLPDVVQTGPVKAIATGDIDRDGHLDFLYFGNHFPVEVETARFDGLVHGICFGDGKGMFKARAFSAFVEPFMGDYRDVVLLPGVTGTAKFVLTQNDGSAMVYKVSETSKRNN